MTTLSLKLSRRAALTSALGLAAAASLAESPQAGSSLTDLVSAFCGAWSSKNLSKPLAYLSDDCVYRMTETTPPAVGHDAISKSLRAYVEAADRLEFRILEVSGSGPIVMTHRIDTFDSKTLPLTWEGIGVFFIKDAKIKEWSDYTIRVSRSVARP